METEVIDGAHVVTALSLQSLAGITTPGVSPIVFGIAIDWAGYPVTPPVLAAEVLLGFLSVGLFRWIRHG
jgi:hypothetical protein